MLKPMKLWAGMFSGNVTAVLPATDKPGGTFPVFVLMPSSNKPVSSSTNNCCCVDVLSGLSPVLCWKA